MNKTTLLNVLKAKNIDVDSDILSEIFKYVEVDADISQDELLDELSMDRLDYSGAVHEAVDSSVDVYYSELDKWVGAGNGHWIETAISDGLCDGSDFYKSVQCGQYLAIMDEVLTDLANIGKEVEELD